MTSEQQSKWIVYAYHDDHLMGHESWKQLLLRIVRMPADEQYTVGLPLLDEYWAKHSHLDDDGWLRRSILSFRASIMESAGHPAEALAEYQALARFGLHAWYEPIELAFHMGRCLLALQRHEEAVETLEQGLAHIPESPLYLAIMLLHRLNQVCAVLGRPVPARHASLLHRAAAVKDIDIPARLRDDPARLGDAIDWVYERSGRQPSQQAPQASQPAPEQAPEK